MPWEKPADLLKSPSLIILMSFTMTLLYTVYLTNLKAFYSNSQGSVHQNVFLTLFDRYWGMNNTVKSVYAIVAEFPDNRGCCRFECSLFIQYLYQQIHEQHECTTQRKKQLLLEKVCIISIPCSTCIMRLLMAGIIMGPVYGSLKIWLSTGIGVYISEENRGSQAVSMTAKRQCDREGRWAGKRERGRGWLQRDRDGERCGGSLSHTSTTCTGISPHLEHIYSNSGSPSTNATLCGLIFYPLFFLQKV